jgi:hypothetical protein
MPPRSPVTAFPAPHGAAMATAVRTFLAERDLAPASRRVYALALQRLIEYLGADTAVSRIRPRMLTRFMTSTYPHLAPASWNRVVATLG